MNKQDRRKPVLLLEIIKVLKKDPLLGLIKKTKNNRVNVKKKV
jgi:hypothetical protein